jgi:hypothetical protein
MATPSNCSSRAITWRRFCGNWRSTGESVSTVKQRLNFVDEEVPIAGRNAKLAVRESAANGEKYEVQFAIGALEQSVVVLEVQLELDYIGRGA